MPTTAPRRWRRMWWNSFKTNISSRWQAVTNISWPTAPSPSTSELDPPFKQHSSWCPRSGIFVSASPRRTLLTWCWCPRRGSTVPSQTMTSICLVWKMSPSSKFSHLSATFVQPTWGRWPPVLIRPPTPLIHFGGSTKHSGTASRISFLIFWPQDTYFVGQLCQRQGCWSHLC